MNKDFNYEYETDEDRTVRMLKRRSVAEVEALADELGVWADNQRSFIVDRDFLYDNGYTVEEWFAESQGVRVRKAVTQINNGLRKHLNAKLKKQNV